MQMVAVKNSRVWQMIPLIVIMLLFCSLDYGKVIYVDDDG